MKKPQTVRRRDHIPAPEWPVLRTLGRTPNQTATRGPGTLHNPQPSLRGRRNKSDAHHVKPRLWGSACAWNPMVTMKWARGSAFRA
eukprot:2884644-Alexandrium_andersonii.AAC.1